MSWVIARHIFKSGNWNIYSRVGRYNYASSKKCQYLKSRAHAVIKSQKYKTLACPTNVSSAVLYTRLDKYIGFKTLYVDHQYNGDLPRYGRGGYWESKQKFYGKLSSNYAKELTNMIYKDCTSGADVLRKYNRTDSPESFTETSRIFSDISIFIISKNRKFSGLLEFLKFHATPRDNLLKKTVTYCMHRWEGRV
tara:strand:- start:262 stop:843 length:582 start_codon:yes stop_codon:yes gene_type:complete